MFVYYLRVCKTAMRIEDVRIVCYKIGASSDEKI